MRAGFSLVAAALSLLSFADLAEPSQAAAANAPHGFALVIGDCIWQPPSPAAAVAAVLYFFGVGATTGGEAYVHDFHLMLADQYVAAGQTEKQATEEVAKFDGCVASYVPEPAVK